MSISELLSGETCSKIKDNCLFQSFAFQLCDAELQVLLLFRRVSPRARYESMRFHAWKRHEIIVWNHMIPCMELHVALDPGRLVIYIHITRTKQFISQHLRIKTSIVIATLVSEEMFLVDTGK